MGGVCAVVDLAGGPVPPDTIDVMLTAAEHRGPDGVLAWRSSDAGLGELSLSVWADPPTTLEHDGYVVAADARLDDPDELPATLRAAGTLSGHQHWSDAELILGAYRAWGWAAPAQLLGDFAFVIWDPARRTLVAARDTSGVKPLYVCREGSRIFLASEVKQILRARNSERRINEQMLGAFLLASPGRPEWTFYAGIEQIPPAHVLVASPDRYQVKRYWDIDPEASLRLDTEDDYAARLRDLLGDATRARMTSRRPMGIWLSGGLDSCSIASVAGRMLEEGAPGSLRAFSFAFDELADADERRVSRHIVEHYGLASSDIPADDAWPLRDGLEPAIDEDDPVMGAYRELHDRVYAAATEIDIGAMFMGTSGDLIAGSEVFDYPGELRRRPLTAWRHLREHATAMDESVAYTFARRVVWPMAASVLPGFEQWSASWLARRQGEALLPGWIDKTFAARIGLEEILRWRPPSPQFARRAHEVRYRSVTDGFTMRGAMWNERNHARHGMAYLDPWSDRRLAAFAVAVPQWLFNRGRERKALVRRAMRGVMPEAARRSAGKVLPSPLYQRGIEQRERERVARIFPTSRLADMGVIDADRLLVDIQAGTSEGAEWPVIATELWLERFWA